MKTWNNEGDRVPTSHLLGSHENPQAIKATAKTTDCSSQTDSKDSLLKTTSMQLTKYDGEVNLVPTQNFYPYVLMSLVWEGTLQATKGET